MNLSSDPDRSGQPECSSRHGGGHKATSGVHFTVSVVLPAGGTGERTGLVTPKQFYMFLNRPLISYTIQAFERLSWIQHIVVVVAEESIALMTDIVQRFQHTKVRVVSGGATRHRSIFNGVQALDPGESAATPDVVIIHDAVRPFVEEDFLLEIAMAAKENGASGAIRPLVSTVIATTSEGYLDHSLERGKYRASEMPQGFLYCVIHQAYQKCSEFDFDFGTECLHLALQHTGTRAKLIEGPPTLWKVTYKRDLAAAESIIKETLCRSACLTSDGSKRARELGRCLQKLMASLDMELDVLPEPIGDASRLSKEWNFIKLFLNGSGLSEVEETVKALEAANRALLHPVVVVWVRLETSDGMSVSETGAGHLPLMELASAAKLQNILLYGIHFLLSEEDAGFSEGSVKRLAELTYTLIHDRNALLAGQILCA
ncbi:D-ribitol-5-phosphate cytidylyltransferase isoform X1 [Gadus morhua]|uniref:D-ribitol-5-phosphate cytidylyltransferase n=1 Tax=Gadus morhua TaxID=8049 RepID=A0A8C4Z2E5_GADMO|nr:D-ribitol-5-phosphate cytidylyltransferase isoform X1 [Gadus morhua]